MTETQSVFLRLKKVCLCTATDSLERDNVENTVGHVLMELDPAQGSIEYNDRRRGTAQVYRVGTRGPWANLVTVGCSFGRPCAPMK